MTMACWWSPLAKLFAVPALAASSGSIDWMSPTKAVATACVWSFRAKAAPTPSALEVAGLSVVVGASAGMLCTWSALARSDEVPAAFA